MISWRHSPQATFRIMTPDGPVAKTTDDLLQGPQGRSRGRAGRLHADLPSQPPAGYVEKLNDIKAKGVDAILVTAVNDVFVMEAWSKSAGAEGIEFISDGNGDFAKALGLSMDGTGFGLGIRSQRYSGWPRRRREGLNVEDAPPRPRSGAENLLKDLDPRPAGGRLRPPLPFLKGAWPRRPIRRPGCWSDRPHGLDPVP